MITCGVCGYDAADSDDLTGHSLSDHGPARYPIEVGTRVVVKHPHHRGAFWGAIDIIDGGCAHIAFDIFRESVWVPIAILHAPVMPEHYKSDGVGEHYWRKDQEVTAEQIAFRHNPANKGKTFWPDTFID